MAAAIERRSTVASVREKSGKTGQLVFVEVEHITRADNVEVVRELQTIVYREATTYMAPLPAIGAPDLSNWEWSRTVTPDTTMLFRFSAITFNSHRIHYDLPYALNQEYYPGLVVHGPLMAALLLDLAARRFGPNALSRFSYKSLSPAFAGQPLHLVGRGAAQIELCAIGADGRMVVSATATLRGNDHKSAPPVS
ncbi:COGs COG3777 [Sphingobium indicum BiD32]|uniref:COGs COG3777 n=1 Tax=Sphingobium indicum BiD32 TaxID=1301087 RepID=N1MNB8_9SPHN|nr:COGs COG3777 [Sphingobium indicum BiD32]